MTDWYFMDGARSVGPVPFDSLVAKVRDNVIQRGTLIWSPGFSDWTPAVSVDGLFRPPATQPDSSTDSTNARTANSHLISTTAPVRAEGQPIAPTGPKVVDQQAHRTKRLKAWAIGFVALSIGYACFAGYAAIVYFDANRLIGNYGYGHVPANEMRVYMWVAENSAFVEFAFIAGMAIAALTTFCMMINTLSQLGVPQQRNPKWSFFSFFIPFWNLYRPWAGIAEVRNTMKAAVKHQEWPEKALKGFDLPSLLFGCWFAFLLVVNLIEKQIVKEMGRRTLDATNVQSTIAELSVLMTANVVTSILYAIFFGLFVTAFLKLYRRFITLAGQAEAEELASSCH